MFISLLALQAWIKLLNWLPFMKCTVYYITVTQTWGHARYLPGFEIIHVAGCPHNSTTPVRANKSHLHTDIYDIPHGAQICAYEYVLMCPK